MTIMSAISFYMIPALLGRIYDMKNQTVGPDIFRREDVANAKVIETFLTTSEYRVVSEMSEATDFLDVSGELSLKLKTGAINVDGTGNYLKETGDFHNKIDLLIKVHYITVTKTLPSSIKPVKDWEQVLNGTGATHYVRSIVYGGDLIASVRFVTANSKDKETIKAMVQGSLNSASGSFGGGLKGDLEKIKSKVSDSASMDINYYATVPLEDIPRTIDGLTQLVEKFPDQTKKINDGIGVPLSMELFSLEGLAMDRQTYFQTLALGDQMLVINEMLSDVREAKKRLSDWLKTVPPTLPDEEIQKVGKFQSTLDSIDSVFCKVIANLDLSSDAAGDQFKPAFDAYSGSNKISIPSMYVKMLSKLKKSVLDNTPSFEADFGGAHFNYWGSASCPDKSKFVYSGLMGATDRESIGSAQFTCLPQDQQFPSDDQGGEDIDDYPRIWPVAFVSRKKDAKESQKAVKCSACRVPGKTAVSVFDFRTECPTNWTMQYQGVMISTDFSQVRGQLVCLDVSKPFADHPGDQATVVTEVSPKCDNFPCNQGLSQASAVPCVVCSITKKKKPLSQPFRL